MLITLSEADRERLGAPERLPADLLDTTARETMAIAEVLGFADSLALAEAFDAMFVRDGQGEVTAVRRNANVFLALVWLGLRRARVLTARGRTEMAAELEGLDFQLSQVGFAAEELEEAKPDAG